MKTLFRKRAKWAFPLLFLLFLCFESQAQFSEQYLPGIDTLSKKERKRIARPIYKKFIEEGRFFVYEKIIRVPDSFAVKKDTIVDVVFQECPEYSDRLAEAIAKMNKAQMRAFQKAERTRYKNQVKARKHSLDSMKILYKDESRRREDEFRLFKANTRRKNDSLILLNRRLEQKLRASRESLKAQIKEDKLKVRKERIKTGGWIKQLSNLIFYLGVLGLALLVLISLRKFKNPLK